MTMVNFRPKFIVGCIKRSSPGAADVAMLSAGDKRFVLDRRRQVLDPSRAMVVPAVRHRAIDPGAAHGAEERASLAPVPFHECGPRRRRAASGFPELALPSPANGPVPRSTGRPIRKT